KGKFSTSVPDMRRIRLIMMRMCARLFETASIGRLQASVHIRNTAISRRRWKRLNQENNKETAKLPAVRLPCFRCREFFVIALNMLKTGEMLQHERSCSHYEWTVNNCRLVRRYLL